MSAVPTSASVPVRFVLAVGSKRDARRRGAVHLVSVCLQLIGRGKGCVRVFPAPRMTTPVVNISLVPHQHAMIRKIAPVRVVLAARGLPRCVRCSQADAAGDVLALQVRE